MIEGIVNNFDEPIIKLDIHLSSSTSKKVSAIIDTGFNGYISIPATLIEKSNWDFLGTEEYELAKFPIDNHHTVFYIILVIFCILHGVNYRSSYLKRTILQFRS